MPELVRLYIRHVALGAVASVVFVAMLIGFDVAHLRHLVMTSPQGWIALLMLFVANAIVFSGVQFGIAVMGLAEDEGPTGGRFVPEPRAVPIPVRVDPRR